jgi:hypothetical protein
MSRSVRSLLLVAAVALSGCYKTKLTNVSPGGSPGAEVKVWSHALLAGLIPLSEIDVGSKCGDKGVWKVDTKVGFLSLLAAGITSSIYSPTNVVITCKG